jgi:hypothetical protein
MDTSQLIEYLLLKGELARARDPRLRSALQQCLAQAEHKLANSAITATAHASYRKQAEAETDRVLRAGSLLSTRS